MQKCIMCIIILYLISQSLKFFDTPSCQYHTPRHATATTAAVFINFNHDWLKKKQTHPHRLKSETMLFSNEFCRSRNNAIRNTYTQMIYTKI